MHIRAGKLRQSVTLQTRSVASQDAQGGDVVTWTDSSTVWADIRALQGREFEAAGQRWADARFKVTMRYTTGIRRQDRIVWGERTLDILDVEDPDGRKQALVLFCAEVS